MSHHEWGWMVVVYLFLGGLGAGSLALSGIAHLSHRRRLLGVARAGALVAPLLVAVGSGLLLLDLGRPTNFWRLFATINPVSPMSVGSWLLSLFVVLSAVYAVLHLPPAWLRAVADRLPRLAGPLTKLADWNQPLADPTATPPEPVIESTTSADVVQTFPHSPVAVARLRGLLAGLGIPLGLSVGIYTGVLLGAIPARPFWNTPMVAQLFLFSALSTSAALLLMLAPALWNDGAIRREQQRQALVRADLLFIFLELFIIVPFIIHSELSVLSSRKAIELILGGEYTQVFWLGVVGFGIMVPMLVEIIDTMTGLHRLPPRVQAVMHYLIPVLILSGGYLLRWVFVHAGQDSVFL